MNKVFCLLVCVLTAAVFGAAELRLADATGGAPLEAVMQAAIALAMEGKLEVSMNRRLPSESLADLDAGRVDAVIIDRVFVPNRKQIPLAAEALALYISAANPGAKLTKKQVGEILTAVRPNWKDYNRLDIDIQRIAMKPLSPSGTLIRRVFGSSSVAEEIFRVDSFSSGFNFVNTASIFFAQYIPQAPLEVKCLPIDGVLPTSAQIVEGRYPLSVHYVIVCKKDLPQLKLLMEQLNSDKYRRHMVDSGLIVLF